MIQRELPALKSIEKFSARYYRAAAEIDQQQLDYPCNNGYRPTALLQ